VVLGLAAALSTLAVAPKPRFVVSGRVRAYGFARSYKTGTTDTQASSIALKVHVETAPHDGLGIGLTYYSAFLFSNGAIAPAELESSLPGVRLNTLAEAYAQFGNSHTLIRAGRTTPGKSLLIIADVAPTCVIPSVAKRSRGTGSSLDYGATRLRSG
jgi:hypothetical protein